MKQLVMRGFGTLIVSATGAAFVWQAVESGMNTPEAWFQTFIALGLSIACLGAVWWKP